MSIISEKLDLYLCILFFITIIAYMYWWMINIQCQILGHERSYRHRPLLLLNPASYIMSLWLRLTSCSRHWCTHFLKSQTDTAQWKKGWRCCDLTTGWCYPLRNVVFNESFKRYGVAKVVGNVGSSRQQLPGELSVIQSSGFFKLLSSLWFTVGWIGMKIEPWWYTELTPSPLLGL